MQPITDILKEIDFPIWLVWGIAVYTLAISTAGTMHASGATEKTLLSSIPLKGFCALIISMGMILYFTNDSIGRRKERDYQMEQWKKEVAVMKAIENNQYTKETPNLDPRLQSLEGIIGYLDQSIKMGYEPKELVPIILFLTKEIQRIRDDK